MLVFKRRWPAAVLVLAAVMVLSCRVEEQPDPTGISRSAVEVPLTIHVVGPDGVPISSPFRWLVERDDTYEVVPGVADPQTLSVSFHRSHMPVVQSGASPAQPTIDDAFRHFVSVLPDEGHSMGGAPVAAGQTEVTVLVHPLPLPTAQITIIAFHDGEPINNALDLPAEEGLAGFAVKLEDAGGRYGQSGGTQTMDAFGNPLGTTYDAMGNVDMMGDGVILTGPDGTATIQNLAPGKYGVQIVPPPGSSWVQTSTIEGTKTIDAWVKANEPPYFMEFGPPDYHVAVGFVQPMKDTTVLTGGATLTGQVVNLHMSRPPGAFYNGAPLAHTTPWVGLNLGPLGAGRGVFAAKAQPDGTFSIPDVPPGPYQLVVWDEALDLIFAFHDVTVLPTLGCDTPNGSCDLGEVPVFQWFARLEHHVFHDPNGNGFRDPGEAGIPEMAINLRFRDGTVYQSFPTDVDGFVPFDQVFPFFNWMVAEVDYTRFEATGVTVTVDDGGPVDPTDPRSFGGQLTPQPQSENGGLPYRTETGPVLTQAFQGFIGQTSVLEWGKRAYGPGQNGGISGIVYYATTRAENDPRYAAAEPWEPGIANVRVNLWSADGTLRLNTTETDSWDEAQPTGCQGPPFEFRGEQKDCFDGLKNWNQVRPGVFDGGYAFTTYFPAGVGPDDVGIGPEEALPPGEYLVEVVVPPGYEIVKEEDRNVDFGDSYSPATMLLPPECAGEDHLVPDEFSLFPLFDDSVPPQPIMPFRHGEMAPLCDRKKVVLHDRQNAAADFFLFTSVPIAAHVVGFVLDDAAGEFDPNAPTFGEKYAPPWLPISIRDWTGREIAHTYSDEYGVYNALVPSTYTVNIPNPSGVSPNMLTLCINSPTRQDPTSPAGYVFDPFYNPQYSQFCYTFQFMPGTTTYLDTPVVPVAAFAGPDQYPLDCELIAGTPRVYSVTGAVNGVPTGGPHVPTAGAGRTLTIVAPGADGMVEVPNPAYDGTLATPRTILRDHGFGPGTQAGTVTLGNVNLPITSWAPGQITVTVPTGASTGQLTITRGDTGEESVNAVTVAVGNGGLPVRPLAAGETIQSVIDLPTTTPGTLILVPPGEYDELVVMWKPVRLQGSGEGSVINAVKAPSEKLAAWRAKVTGLIDDGLVDLLPSQEVGFDGVEPITLFQEEGPGVLVLARDVNVNQGGYGRRPGPTGGPNARIDGFTITGGDGAGGVVVNAYAHWLEVGNNRIVGNNGALGGGVRLGHAFLLAEVNDGLEHQSAFNDNIRIHHNQISRNGGLAGAGGGISLYTGSDDYRVTDNFVCGNFTQGDGGGIGHLGLSPDGEISRNTVVFNETFNQGVNASGGGIALVGAPPLVAGELSEGTGSVLIDANTLLGNSAGAGDGGGLYLSRVNGADVAQFNNPVRWHGVDIVNTIVANNVAALAGGGISLQDAAKVRILHVVVANNDSTATAGQAFTPGNPNESTPQPAGVVARAHSPELLAELPAAAPDFSSPTLVNSIVWQNRSFFFRMDDVNFDPPLFELLPAAPLFTDLGVIGVPGALTCTACILTGGPDPQFVAEHFNGPRTPLPIPPDATTALDTTVAFDEGGNWIRVHFGPLTLMDTATLELLGDHHVQPTSPAVDAGQLLTSPDEVDVDIDGQPRPSGGASDIGADEIQVP